MDATMTTEIAIRWDTQSDPSNPGWLVQHPVHSWMPPAPSHYGLSEDADQSDLDAMVTATMRWEGATTGSFRAHKS